MNDLHKITALFLINIDAFSSVQYILADYTVYDTNYSRAFTLKLTLTLTLKRKQT